jgi:peptide/nickel transport system permease protein
MTTRSRHIRKRLLRNKGALFGLIVIGLSILTAVFAYFLAPDGSPDANRIIVEIGGRPPGFRQLFLPVRKERLPPPVGFFHRLASGREDRYDYIPINSAVAKGDSLIVQKFVDEDVEERRAWPLSAILSIMDGQARDRGHHLLAGHRQIWPRYPQPPADRRPRQPCGWTGDRIVVA